MSTKKLSILLVIFAALLLGGCSALLPRSPGQPSDLDAAYTQAAQTIVAQFTQQAIQTAIAQATAQASPVVVQPTATSLIPQTGNSTPTATLVPPSSTPLVPTPVPPTPVPPSPTPIPCNQALFVGDVSVEDGTVFSPGAEFTKIWRLRNTGVCTWNTSYSLVFVEGDAMTRQNGFSLPGNVRPGETVDLAVDLRAPSGAGRYRGYWMLRSPEGSLFGIGADADSAFWVSIRVLSLPPDNSNYNFDFVGNMCAASWRSSAGQLPCPGPTDSDDGSINFLDSPRLEDGRQENEPALWTRPETSSDGWMVGTYPAYRVRNGDHFLAEVGCLENSRGCDLNFVLDYQVGNEPVRNLGVWREVYDGKVTRIDIDLSSLAGLDVKFILSVANHGKPGSAEGFWLVPSIRQGTATDPGFEKIPAAVAARDRLAQALGISSKNVQIRSVEERTWSDSCLGVVQADIVCSEVIVPGYRIIMVANGRQYEAHTNLDGSIVVWFEN